MSVSDFQPVLETSYQRDLFRKIMASAADEEKQNDRMTGELKN